MTPKQIAASRANGRKSHGPTTTGGKSKSRFNALKHGIHAESQTIFTESVEDLAELTAELHDQYGPADPTERFLVDALVNNEWRLRRMRVIETDLWQSAVDRFLEKHTEMQSATPGDAFEASGPAFERLQRVINSCERNYHRALKELKALAAAANSPQTEVITTSSESPGSFGANPEMSANAAPENTSEGAASDLQPAQASAEDLVPDFAGESPAFGASFQANGSQI
jgi:hypothetical protein